MLYGIVSAVIGYIIGVILINLAYAANLMPSNFYPNYSSSAILLVLVLCICTVLLSTLYPAIKSSRLVTPSFVRKWRRPSRPLGDDWVFNFPFIFEDQALKGILAYIKEYLMMHSTAGAGSFASEEVSYIKLEEPRTPSGWVPALKAKIWLAPFEMGIRQTIILRPIPEREDRNSFSLLMHRDAGFRDTWLNANEYFMDNIRKQFLLWRALPPKDKEKYLNMGEKEIKFDADEQNEA